MKVASTCCSINEQKAEVRFRKIFQDRGLGRASTNLKQSCAEATMADKGMSVRVS